MMSNSVCVCYNAGNDYRDWQLENAPKIGEWLKGLARNYFLSVKKNKG